MTRSPASGAWDVRYEAVVRVTITTRLATATKLWCGCAVEDGAEPNANTCPVCLGLPGTLPVLNGAAVERGVAGAAALGAEVQRVSDFAREHRPPDPRTPKGYVLTQRRRPLAVRGGVQIGETLEGAPMRAAIKCAYLAEDVGRAVHGRFAHESGLDYNIAGAPLLIIEGEADLRSPPEARAFVASVAALLADSGASDAPLERRTLQVTAHVAIRARGDLKAGPECQVRHLATLDAVERGVETECARQAALRDAGAPVEPGVRLWDDAAGAAAPARAPEPPVWELVDPDLSGLVLTAEWIAERRAALPELGPARRERLRRDHALPPATLAAVAGDLPFAEYVESVVRLHGDGTRAGQWIEAHLLPYMARESLGVRDVARRVRPSDLAQLLDLLRDGRLSDDAAERVYRRMLRAGVGVKDAAEREGFVILDADA